MKTLTKVGLNSWIDISLITGVSKFEKGFRLNLGDNGAQFPHTMTKKEIRAILKRADIKGF